MQSGIIYGFASMIDGMVDKIREEVGNPKLEVVATGGLAKLIIPLCRNHIKIYDELILSGLISIFYKNL